MSVGGAFLTISVFDAFYFEMINGRGWICIALVIFASWRPGKALLGALLFGAFDALQVRLQTEVGALVPGQVFLMAPYILSIIALVELDDSSHERPARQKRDLFLEKACAAAGLHLLRFPARPTYALSHVRAELAKLDASISPASAAPAPTTQIGRSGVRP